MSITIAISGKGGVGKSTIAVAIIRWLNDRWVKSVLAVDADANVNLCDLLGTQPGEPLGAIREEFKQKIGELPQGMTKQQFLEYRIHRSMVETENFDLITMGRPEGPGCYCYANNLLRDILKTISDNYEYTVIDNEAGMEHLSRRTVQNIDYLFIVSDPTLRGIKSAGRISRLLIELDTRVGKKFLLLNCVQNPVSSLARDCIASEGLEVLAILPEDPLIRKCDDNGRPVYEIVPDSDLYRSLDKALASILPLQCKSEKIAKKIENQ